MREYRNWIKKSLLIMVAIVSGLMTWHGDSDAFAGEQVGPRPTRHDPKYADDEKAIMTAQAAYIKAFNTGDAKALAAFWASDGEFEGADAKSIKGRDAIAKDFAAFFAETKGLKLDVHTNSLRFVNSDVALESGTSRVTGPDRMVNATTYHVVHAKRDGQWQLESVRESAYTPSSNYELLSGLEWLIGNWSAKNAGRTLEVACEWTAKRNFILRKYSLKEADGNVKTGMQVIGWDPVAGGVRSWVFDSDGGFGSESWTKDGKKWVLEATGVTRDGAQIMATNILTPVDHDNFTWQSVRRSLNDVRLPDTEIIKVNRVKAKN
jgi:uncharacterized protein (TIGR02246 family)